jgi:hypothetical protein
MQSYIILCIFRLFLRSLFFLIEKNNEKGILLEAISELFELSKNCRCFSSNGTSFVYKEM